PPPALDEVRPGMRVGLGSGRTAEHFVRLLGARARGGFDVTGVPTSERVAALARAEGIRIATLDDEPVLDLVVDGADEIDPQLRLIKGGGGALLREKIVATAAKRMVVVAEAGKLVDTLGAFPLPVEIVPFGAIATQIAIERSLAKIGLDGPMRRRQADGRCYVTDNGNHILDITFGRIPDPGRLARALDAIPGVIEHGLFIGLATVALVAGETGVKRISA
ncbi:MAG: ribose-5-phosphate isomerase RpiA, partial [Bauldia sp.]